MDIMTTFAQRAEAVKTLSNFLQSFNPIFNKLKKKLQSKKKLYLPFELWYQQDKS